MVKIAFICHGNICRSVMADYMLKDYVLKHNIENIYVDSFAVSSEEIGNTIYPPARACLAKHNIKIYNHKAKKITQSDYENFDKFYYMDDYNKVLLDRLIVDKDKKIHKLLDKDVADPWYTGNFEETYNDLVKGIEMIMEGIYD